MDRDLMIAHKARPCLIPTGIDATGKRVVVSGLLNACYLTLGGVLDGS